MSAGAEPIRAESAPEPSPAVGHRTDKRATLALLLVPFVLIAVLKGPFLSVSPLNNDVALVLGKAEDLALGHTALNFGELWMYRPVLPAATAALLSVWPGPVSPENALRALTLLSLLATAIIAAMLGLWLHRRARVPLPAALAAQLCFLCMPVVLAFCGEGLSTTLALPFALSALFCADAAAREQGARQRAALALLVGPLLLFAVLTRETMALMSLPCAERLLRAPLARFRFRLLLLTALGGVAAVALWLGLEAAVLHPDRSLQELWPAAGIEVNLVRPRFFETWDDLGAIVIRACGLGVTALAVIGALLPGRRPLPRSPFLLWIAAFFLLQQQFFSPALRIRLVFAVPILCLALRALPLWRRPTLAALMLVALAVFGFVRSLSILLPLSRLPHADMVRVERMLAHAGPDDMFLLLGSDSSYGYWLLPRERVVGLWDLLPPEQQRDRVREELHDPAVLRQILHDAVAPAIASVGAAGRRVLMAPGPGRLAAVQALAEDGLEVTVVETIPPGRSRSQGDPYGLLIGFEDVTSREAEHVVRIGPKR